MIKDPETGRRVSRINPPSEWIVHHLPELAIVDRETFGAAARLRVANSQGPHLHHARRPKHVLSGLIRCGCCGESMTIVSRDRLGCSGHKNKAICSNAKMVHGHY